MGEYASTATAERLSVARKQLQAGTSQATSFTAAETYQGILQRHRRRQDHQQRIDVLEKEGRTHAVQNNPGTCAAVQSIAAARSFPAISTPSSECPASTSTTTSNTVTDSDTLPPSSN
eukprot:scpid78110/ scgid5599/ 